MIGSQFWNGQRLLPSFESFHIPVGSRIKINTSIQSSILYLERRASPTTSRLKKKTFEEDVGFIHIPINVGKVIDEVRESRRVVERKLHTASRTYAGLRNTKCMWTISRFQHIRWLLVVCHFGLSVHSWQLVWRGSSPYCHYFPSISTSAWSFVLARSFWWSIRLLCVFPYGPSFYSVNLLPLVLSCLFPSLCAGRLSLAIYTNWLCLRSSHSSKLPQCIINFKCRLDWPFLFTTYESLRPLICESIPWSNKHSVLPLLLFVWLPVNRNHAL